MGFQKSRLVAVVFLLGFASHADAQDNAVAGSVRIKRSEAALSDVRVIVAQMPEIHDTTSAKDGVYVLRMPRSLKKFDLVYEHDDFIRIADEGILNEQSQNKRPIVEMRSNKAAAISSLTAPEIDQIIADAYRMTIRGVAESLPSLVTAGKANLNALMVSANTLSDDAQRYSKAGNFALAEAEYVKAISILEKISPRSTPLAQTVESYAALLRATNQETKAAQQTAKAALIRLEAQAMQGYRSPVDRDVDAAFSGMAWGRWELVYSRNDANAAEKFAVDNASALPNLEETVAVVWGNGRQYGRISVPAAKSGTFRLYISGHSAPIIQVLGVGPEEFALEVTDENGTKVSVDSDYWVSSNRKASTYIVRLSNKTPKNRDYIVRLSSIPLMIRP